MNKKLIITSALLLAILFFLFYKITFSSLKLPITDSCAGLGGTCEKNCTALGNNYYSMNDKRKDCSAEEFCCVISSE